MGDHRVLRVRTAFVAGTVVALVAAGMAGSGAASALPATAKVVKLGGKVTPVGHPVAGTLAHFSLAPAVPHGDSLVGYSVNFGDHTKKVSAKKVPKSLAHPYGKPGTYPVTVTITDKHKHSAILKTKIIIKARPGAGAATVVVTPPTSVPAPAPADTTPIVSPAAPAPGIAGTAYGWGDDDGGQAGNGPSTSSCSCVPRPAAISGLGPVVQLVGSSQNGSTGDGYALLKDGTVWAWGADDVGQLGNGTTSGTPSSTPTQVVGIRGIQSIAAGTAGAYAVDSIGIVWAWGDNTLGQLGNDSDGAGKYSATPVAVSGLPQASAVAAGSYNGYALGANGSVYAWGANDSGQLATAATDPQTADDCGCSPAAAPVPGLGNVTAIAANGASVYALGHDTKVAAWGADSDGQLGSGTPDTSAACDCNDTPTDVAGLSGVSAIAAGGDAAYALVGGKVWAWGFNENGELGNGTAASATDGCSCDATPTAIPTLSGVTQIAANEYSGYAVAGGSVFAWGDNRAGQLGRGTVTTFQDNGCGCSATPATVPGSAGVTAIGGGPGSTAYAVVAS